MEQIAFFAGRAAIVAVDLCGHGQSDAPHQYVGRQRGAALAARGAIPMRAAGGDCRPHRYARHELAEDLYEVFTHYCGERNVVFAHSYGVSIVLSLYPRLRSRLSALVLLSLVPADDWPQDAPPVGADASPPKRVRAPGWLVWMPDAVLYAMRYWDRRGGIASASVRRMLHPSASASLKLQQLRWNAHTPSHVVKGALSVRAGTIAAPAAPATARLTRRPRRAGLPPTVPQHCTDSWYECGATSCARSTRPRCCAAARPTCSHRRRTLARRRGRCGFSIRLRGRSFCPPPRTK